MEAVKLLLFPAADAYSTIKPVSGDSLAESPFANHFILVHPKTKNPVWNEMYPMWSVWSHEQITTNLYPKSKD